MTLKQLEYVVKVAECGTVSGAAKALFVAQPSLSAAIQELESEMHLTLFHRTNKGVIVTKEGEVFLSYARQILEQTALLESRYKGDPVRKQAFCVSTQHYSFAVNAFVDLIRERGGDRYDFSLRETQTYEIIEDVAQRKSEIGLLYLNDFNRTALQNCCGEPIWILHPCLPPTRMYFSAAITRSPVPGQCLLTIWRHILICPLSRGITIPFIFRKRSSARQCAAKISGCGTAPPCLIC